MKVRPLSKINCKAFKDLSRVGKYKVLVAEPCISETIAIWTDNKKSPSYPSVQTKSGGGENKNKN